ncbi:MAG: hypothetical protein M3Z33_07720 [Actinomycetota bacterium]|nr:hypothetical protein [Actinomycetota bacterium]
MAEFNLVIKEFSVELNRAQLEAITRWGTAHGGSLELRAAGFSTLRLRDTAGQELLVRRDGGIEPFN